MMEGLSHQGHVSISSMTACTSSRRMQRGRWRTSSSTTPPRRSVTRSGRTWAFELDRQQSNARGSVQRTSGPAAELYDQSGRSMKQMCRTKHAGRICTFFSFLFSLCSFSPSMIRVCVFGLEEGL